MDVRVRLGTEQYTTDGNRLDLTLPLGRYRLQTEKPGFKPLSRDIFLTTDEEIGIRLEALHTLTVYADMEESRVLLDGNLVGTAGRTTPLELSLLDGEYNLSLTNPVVSKPFQQKILLQEDQIIRAELPHPKVAIHLNVDDVLITAGKKEYQVKGREFALKLPVGTYRLTARKPGYIPAEQEIRIETQDIDLPINLEEVQYRSTIPPAYPLSVRSNIDKTAVHVKCKDGKEYSGLASPRKPFLFQAAAGTCTVSARREGYQEVSKPAALPTEKEITFNLIPEEEEKTELPEKKEQSVVQVEQPVAQAEAEKNEPIPVEQIEQSAEQSETEEKEPALIEIRPGKFKVKPGSVRQDGKTKRNRRSVQRKKKKNNKEQAVVRSAKQPETKKKSLIRSGSGLRKKIVSMKSASACRNCAMNSHITASIMM